LSEIIPTTDWVRSVRTTLKSSERDFHQVKPWIYWRDMFIGTTVAYGSAGVFLASPAFSMLQIASFIVAVFWLYRAGSLVHEVAHLGGHELTAFKVTWNILVGVPTLTPSTFFTGHHRDHHTQRVYGTPTDPEYVINVFNRGRITQILLYFVVVALFPILVFVRFLLAPVTFLTPTVRNYVLRRVSSFTFNRHYQRPLSRLNRKVFASLELLCFLRALCIPVAVLLALTPWTRMFQLYFLGAAVVTLNQLRQLADHHFEGDGQSLSMGDHIMDSCNYVGRDPITWLFFPMSIQYHALHHLFPSLPYHNLASAHKFLMKTLPASSPYRDLEQPSWWSVARNVFRADAS
jgi:fatty acid desaturase